MLEGKISENLHIERQSPTPPTPTPIPGHRLSNIEGQQTIINTQKLLKNCFSSLCILRYWLSFNIWWPLIVHSYLIGILKSWLKLCVHRLIWPLKAFVRGPWWFKTPKNISMYTLLLFLWDRPISLEKYLVFLPGKYNLGCYHLEINRTGGWQSRGEKADICKPKSETLEETNSPTLWSWDF